MSEVCFIYVYSRQYHMCFCLLQGMPRTSLVDDPRKSVKQQQTVIVPASWRGRLQQVIRPKGWWVMGDGWWVFDGSTGWWFQTCLEFSIWDVILPIDEVIFFSGVVLDHGIPPTSLWWIILMMISPIQLMDKVHPSIYSWYYDDNIHLW